MRLEVLEYDRELAAHLPELERPHAQAALWAACLELPRGPWTPPPAGSAPGLGLLVLDGVLTREVHLAGGVGAEILGEGDLLRPWDDDRAHAPVPPTVEWCVLQPARLAVLDRRFAHAACAWPDLVVEFHSRLLRRARWLACLLALSDIHRLEPRLLALLWHLADRWGSVSATGVTVPLALTHRTLGTLIGAERPSVSRSMHRLETAGAIAPRTGGGWILQGDVEELLKSMESTPVTPGTATPV